MNLSFHILFQFLFMIKLFQKRIEYVYQIIQAMNPFILAVGHSSNSSTLQQDQKKKPKVTHKKKKKTTWLVQLQKIKGRYYQYQPWVNLFVANKFCNCSCHDNMGISRLLHPPIVEGTYKTYSKRGEKESVNTHSWGIARGYAFTVVSRDIWISQHSKDQWPADLKHNSTKEKMENLIAKLVYNSIT